MTMLAWLQQLSKQAKLKFPSHNYKKLLTERYWNGEGFWEDESHAQMTGDSLLFPFWTGVISSNKKLKICLDTIHAKKLDKPFPLKYSSNNGGRKVAAALFAPNYEGTSIWAHLGFVYLKLVKNVFPKRFTQHICSYKKMIEKYGTFLEVYNARGKPYKSFCYTSDEGMLWAANYLVLR